MILAYAVLVYWTFRGKLVEARAIIDGLRGEACAFALTALQT